MAGPVTSRAGVALADGHARALVIGLGGAPPAADGERVEPWSPVLALAERTVTDFGQVLVSRCGLRAENVRMLPAPSSPAEVSLALLEESRQPVGTLVVSYVGHAFVEDEQLYLVMPGTDPRPDHRAHTALRFAAVLAPLRAARANRVLLILDCAIPDRHPPFTPADRVADLDVGRSRNLEVIASGARYAAELAASGPHTDLSGALIRIMTDGDVGGPERLTLGYVRRRLEYLLPARHRPAPRGIAAGWADNVIVCGNPVHVPAPEDPLDDAPLPQVPYAAVIGAQTGVAPAGGPVGPVVAAAASAGAAAGAAAAGPAAAGPAAAETGPLEAGSVAPMPAGLSASDREAAGEVLVRPIAAEPVAVELPPLDVPPSGTIAPLHADENEPARARMDDAGRADLLEAAPRPASAEPSRVVAATAGPAADLAPAWHSDRSYPAAAAADFPYARSVLLDERPTVDDDLDGPGDEGPDGPGGAGPLPRSAGPGWRRSTAVLAILLVATLIALVAVVHSRSGVADGRDAARSRWVAQAAVAARGDAGVSAQLAAAAFALDDNDTTRGALLGAPAAGAGVPTRYSQAGGAAGSAGAPAAPAAIARPAIDAAAYAPDRSYFVTGNADGTADVWRTGRTGQAFVLPAAGPAHAAVRAVAVNRSSTVVATGGEEGAIRLWNPSTPARPLATLPPASGPVTALAFSPTADILATGSYQAAGSVGDVALWNVRDPAHPRLIGYARNAGPLTRAIAFSPDGALLVTGSRYRYSLLWAVRAEEDAVFLGQMPVPAAGSDAEVSAIAFDGPGRRLVTGDTAGTLAVYAVAATGSVTFTSSTRLPAPISAIAPDPASAASGPGLAAVATTTGAPALYSLARPSAPLGYLSDGGAARALAFSGDGSVLATGGDDGIARGWATPGSPLVSSTGAPPVAAVGLGTGRLLATASAAGTVDVWDLADPARPRRRGSLATGLSSVTTVAASRDGGTLVVAGRRGAAGTADVVSLADSDRPVVGGSVPLGGTPGGGLALSADGMTLAAGEAKAFSLWDIGTPAAPVRLARQTDAAAVGALALSPDGTVLASGDASGSAKLWSVSSDGRRLGALAELPPAGGPVSGLSISADGATLAAAAGGGQVALYRIGSPGSPRRRATLDVPGGGAGAVVFSRSSSTLAVGGASGPRLWTVDDPGSPRPLATIPAPAGVTGLAFTGDGGVLVPVPAGAAAPVLDLDPAAVTRRVCAAAGVPLSKADWSAAVPGVPYSPACPTGS